MNTAFPPEFQNVLTVDPAAAGLGLGVVLAISLAGLLCTVVWVMALVASARREQWVWFVLTLVFGIVALLYFMVGYTPLPRQGRGRGRRRSDSRDSRRRAS